MECMCAKTTPRRILSSERVLGEWNQNPCQLKGKISSTGCTEEDLLSSSVPPAEGIFPVELTCHRRRCMKQDSQPNTTDRAIAVLGRGVIPGFLTPKMAPLSHGGGVEMTQLRKLTYLCSSLPVKHRPSTTPLHLSVFGPTVWNSLPLSLSKTQCFTSFKTKLKTHLFRTHLS